MSIEEERNSKDWMLTYTRRQVWPLAVKATDIDVQDIATALSNQCRYNGHVDRFYSVAEHSVLISRALERDGYPLPVQIIGLHHDDAECYMGDTIKPLKNAYEQAGVYLKPYELAIEKTLSEHFGLPWPWPDVIHMYDRAIVRDEKEALKAGGPQWSAYGIPEMGLNVPIDGWFPDRAKAEFLARHRELYARY